MKSPDFPEGERGAFSPEAHASPTLPSRYYHDAQIYLREQRSIFRKSWCYVGHVSQFSAPGDYRVERVADQCIFLVSAQNSDIRAFFNVCQHRGHELLSGDGKRKKRIVCPYHAWSYGLDGKLIQAPHTDQLQDFDPAEFALKPVRLANCAGLLFANLDGNAGDFETEYPGLAQTLTDSLPAVESFGIAYQFDFDIAANWKIVVDNFSEGYHIPVAHRKLAQVLDSGSGSCARQEQRYAFFESRSKAGYEGLEIELRENFLLLGVAEAGGVKHRVDRAGRGAADPHDVLHDALAAQHLHGAHVGDAFDATAFEHQVAELRHGP